MASPALTAYNASIDSQPWSAQRKQVAKNLGERLYIEGVREGIDHLIRHVNQSITDNAGDTEKVTRFNALKTFMQQVKDDGDSIVNLINNIEEGG